MDGQNIYEAMTPIGALLKGTRAIAVTTASQNFDLSAISEFKGAAAAPIPAYDEMASIFRLRADGGDVYYAFYFDNSGTIDDTNTTQGNATQCDVIPAGQFIDVRIPWTRRLTTDGNGKLCSFLYFKTKTGTATLRVSVCSEPQNKRFG